MVEVEGAIRVVVLAADGSTKMCSLGIAVEAAEVEAAVTKAAVVIAVEQGGTLTVGVAATKGASGTGTADAPAARAAAATAVIAAAYEDLRIVDGSKVKPSWKGSPSK